jgi:hypothetical protein
MIGNKLEQSIISVFQNDLTNTFSINELAKSLKKSYPLINHKSNFFLREGVLKKINIGRSYQCYLNLENDKTKILMSINEVINRELFLDKEKNFYLVVDQITRFLSNSYLRENILTILLVNKELIVVTKNEDPELFDKMNSTIALGKYALKIYHLNSFKEMVLANTSYYYNHIVLFSIGGYLQILSELSDKMLVNGILKNVK